MDRSANATAICDLDAEISLVNADIRDLCDKRRSLWTLRNSKFPFLNLPPEICTFIFSLACHHGRLPEILKWKKALITTPFVISSVCHAWRVMARSTPKLWSSVSICLRLTDEELAMQGELLDQWLCLARSAPLSITMTFDWDGTDELERDLSWTALTAVTSVAASRSHQWESLDLFLPSTWAKTFESKMGCVPNLKSLNLQLTPETDTLPFSRTFCDAPKLRTVTIGYENVDVGLPCHQLEELTFWGHFYGDLPSKALTFLSRCTNLKNFRIHDRANKAITSHMSVHLSKLVSLEIISLRPQQLLGYLAAPSLASITISLEGPDELEAFSAFLTRSDVKLKHLSIFGYVPNKEELLWKIFDGLPNLSYLEIDEPSFQSDGGSERRWLPSRRFFNYFSTPNTASGGLPLPHLTSVKYRGPLKLHASTTPGNADSGDSVDVDPVENMWWNTGVPFNSNLKNDDVDVVTLEKMLLARWNTNLSAGASRLQVFSMSITNSPESVAEMERSPVVKELRREGMHLVFNSVKQRGRMRIYDNRR
jgi:hypothetical protein